MPPGARLGVEELTYPVVKAVAARLGITLVPLAMDGEGLIPEAVEEAHAAAPLHAVYVQPRLHNPLSLTMPVRRTERLADVLLRQGIPAIEDTIWAFLRDELPPLAAYAPECTVLIDSLSKRIAPGLTLGFVVAPDAWASDILSTLRSGGWAPMRFALEAAHRWQQGGTVKALVEAKQREAAYGRRSRLGISPDSPYRVIRAPTTAGGSCPARGARRLSSPPRPGTVSGWCPPARVHRRRSHAPNAIRLGLASPRPDVLSQALGTLAGLARSSPDGLVTD